MIVIDICDDEQLWIDKAREITSAFFKDKGEIWINSYDNSEKMIDALLNREEKTDIVILDIDMPGINGFETARMLKEAYPDLLLLFYTVHEQYVFEAFQFQPFRYIRKVNAKSELELALAAAMKVISKRIERSIILNINNESYAVNINDIVYFETEKRRCIIYLRDGSSLNVRITIKELLSEINSPDFTMIHSGAVVNVRYVKHITNYDVKLENGAHLIVSRGRAENLKAALADYWRRKI